MKTQNIFALAIGAPLLIAVFWNFISSQLSPKKVPVRVKKDPRRK